MVASKKSQNQITAAVFVFLTFFIYGISMNGQSSVEESIAFSAPTNLSARAPASVD